MKLKKLVGVFANAVSWWRVYTLLALFFKRVFLYLFFLPFFGEGRQNLYRKNVLYAACSFVRCKCTLDDSGACHSRASLTYGTRSNKIWYYDTIKYLGGTGELFVGIVGVGKKLVSSQPSA